MDEVLKDELELRKTQKDELTSMKKRAPIAKGF
jgi:hypothetical protein